MERTDSKSVKVPKWALILAPVLLVFLILLIALVQGHGKETSSATESKMNNTSDTLSQWKADPNYQNPLTGIPYDELFRNSEKYRGKFVHYTGEVVQVLGDPNNWNLRVNITQKGEPPYTYWEDTVFILSYSPDRLIEKDLVEFTAQANGVTTYKSVLGGEITIPSLTIYEHKVVGRAE